MFTDTRSKEIVNFCIKNYIPYFIGNPRNDKAVDFIKKFPTDVILSINYLFIINSDLIKLPRKYAINFHGSLLPKYRGRTPHIWSIINNEKETNVSHAFQGNFRVGKLDVDMLNYALESDNHFSSEHLIRSKKNLVITCTDQYPIDVEALLSKLKIRFDKVFISKGDSYTDIELHKQEEYSILHS